MNVPCPAVRHDFIAAALHIELRLARPCRRPSKHVERHRRRAADCLDAAQLADEMHRLILHCRPHIKSARTRECDGGKYSHDRRGEQDVEEHHAACIPPHHGSPQ